MIKGRMFLTGLLIACLASSQPVQISVDFAMQKGKMTPIWAWFGHDEPNYTYMKDGRKLLSELQALSPVPVFVRTHNLLTSGDGVPALKWGSTNVYTEDSEGRPVYHWNIIDSIFDTYIQRGMKPLAQIGFMPEALSSHPTPYQHHWKPGDPYSNIITGWAYPPKDYHKWRELVYQWVKHAVDRYGEKEVASWYWEVWNEPNGYWKGTEQEYFKLYDYAADGLKKPFPPLESEDSILPELPGQAVPNGWMILSNIVWPIPIMLQVKSVLLWKLCCFMPREIQR